MLSRITDSRIAEVKNKNVKQYNVIHLKPLKLFTFVRN